MSEGKSRRPDVVPLTLHDMRMLQEPRSEWSLIARPAIALTDMTGGVVPPRAKVTEGKGIFDELARKPLSVFAAAKSGTEGEEFIAIGPSLTAKQVNALLYFAAPYKGFGFDTRDIINDWTDLYTKDFHAKRKKAHAMMPGWTQFEDSRERVLGVLERNFDGEFDQQDKDDVVIPVLRWRRDAEGNSHIILEPLGDDLQAALAEALPDQIGDTARLDSGMGMMFLAAYSPNNTQWPSYDGYKHSDSSSRQSIGPTQVLAYAYREVARKQADAGQVSTDKDIQASALLSGLGTYIETGEMPTLTVEDSLTDRTETADPDTFGFGMDTVTDFGGITEVPITQETGNYYYGEYEPYIKIQNPGKSFAEVEKEIEALSANVYGTTNNQKNLIYKNTLTNPIVYPGVELNNPPITGEITIFNAADYTGEITTNEPKNYGIPASNYVYFNNANGGVSKVKLESGESHWKYEM